MTSDINLTNCKVFICCYNDVVIGYEKEVCTISKYDDIFECMKYFKDSRYSLYIYENNKPYYEMKEF